jgi:hypothetical protein
MQGNLFSVAFLAGLLLLVSAAVVAVHSIPGPPTAALDFWRPTGEQLDKLEALQRERLSHLPEEAVYRPLTDRLMRANQAASALDAREYRQGLLRHEQGLAHGAARFVADHGWDAYLAVGTFLALRVQEDLRQVAESLYGSRMPLVDWLETHREDPAWKRIRAIAGMLPERCVGAGLIGPSIPPDRDRLLVVRSLWLQRWTALPGGTVAGALAPLEERLILTWKVEAAEHLDLARRLALLDEASRRYPDYPACYVAGVLYASAGHEEEAVEAFRECLSSGDEREASRRFIVALRGFDWEQLL